MRVFSHVMKAYMIPLPYHSDLTSHSILRQLASTSVSGTGEDLNFADHASPKLWTTQKSFQNTNIPTTRKGYWCGILRRFAMLLVSFIKPWQCASLLIFRCYSIGALHSGNHLSSEKHSHFFRTRGTRSILGWRKFEAMNTNVCNFELHVRGTTSFVFREIKVYWDKLNKSSPSCIKSSSSKHQPTVPKFCIVFPLNYLHFTSIVLTLKCIIPPPS